MYHTSLGRAAGTNPIIEYRPLTSQVKWAILKTEGRFHSTLA